MPFSVDDTPFGSLSVTLTDVDGTLSASIMATAPATLSLAVYGAPPGLPAGGLEGQIVVKASDADWDTVWVDNSAETLTATVRNQTGATLAKGTVVYISGGSGNKALVTKASASSESASSKTFAILADDIPNNQNGPAVTAGLLKGLDTTAFTEGANLWLSTTPGEISQTIPTSPDHAVFLGNVTRVHVNQGAIEVRIQNGLELGELHDVLITSVADGQVLKYDAATSLWKNGVITGYATESWVTSQLGSYLTTADASSTYLTLASATSDYATYGWIIAQDFATQSWVSSQNYITNYLADISYLKQSYNLSDLTDFSAARTNLGLGTMATETASNYLTTATASSTYAPLASPALTGTPTAPTASVDTNTTQVATTAYVIGQGYLKSATASSTYAPLASPALTGTPTAPTASAGTNTTQIATTAFVQQEVPAASTTEAGKVELATVAEALQPSSSTLGMTPETTREMLLYPGYIQLYGGGNASVSGAGAVSTFTFASQRYHAMRSPNASTAGFGAYIFDYTFNGIGMAAMTRGSSSLARKWNSRIWVSGRTVLGEVAENTSGLNGNVNCTARVMLGGRTNAATGGMLNTENGIGWKVAGGGSQALVLTVSNGTTLTEVTSSFTPVLKEVFDWKIYSDGAGNVTLWVNDSQVATTTGGPTTSTAELYNCYLEIIEQTASSTGPFGMSNFGSKVFWSQP